MPLRLLHRLVSVAHLSANEELAFWKRCLYASTFGTSFRFGGVRMRERERDVQGL